ncbi:cell wall metabolism sensor histidine kinase WalK [Anaerocolumna aminovalerica]|nr:cell wall metabolism sensor histidine kinase WalK [Anaerocolumna aminovalerica]MBU5333675.1 cell wall metabolism sensor histidine kinase WalK [Anaerocolumna aminovalerica]
MGEQIPVEDIDKIWSKLYKADKSRSRDKGGAGLV